MGCTASVPVKNQQEAKYTKTGANNNNNAAAAVVNPIAVASSPESNNNNNVDDSAQKHIPTVTETPTSPPPQQEAAAPKVDPEIQPPSSDQPKPTEVTEKPEAVQEAKPITPVRGHGQSEFHVDADEFKDVLAAWDNAETTIKKQDSVLERPEPQRRGWKTVRVFVSSTFADMHAEREILVKNCFYDLRTWCEERKLHLLELDLRWGVKKDSTSENTLRTCLSEVDRCREDNGNPYFLNILSERYGWIPTAAEVPAKLGQQYQWVDGFSVTAMEIMHAAYRDCNPNAIFFLRDGEFIKQLPADVAPQFDDVAPFRKAHLNELKDRLRKKFGNRVVDYKATISPHWLKDPVGKVKLDGLEAMSEKALAFLKEHIDLQYPLDPIPPDRSEVERLAHEAFLSSRSRVVLGRDEVFAKISKHINNNIIERPLVLIGHPGCGKSAVVAKAAADAVSAMSEGKYSKVLFHFIGAAPGSTDLVRMLTRIYRMVSAGTAPSDAETLVRSIPAMLGEGAWKRQNPKNPKIAIFIDALNQLDTDDDAQGLRWMPTKTNKDLKLIVSTIDGSECHKALLARSPAPVFVDVGPLAKDICENIVTVYLGEYNKKLDTNQMTALLAKQDSTNPLWLSAACEELRVFGIFEQVDQKIFSLPDNLLSLLEIVLARLEQENDADIIVSTCCLVECSRHGLLESELLELLGMVPREFLLPDKAAILAGQPQRGGAVRVPSNFPEEDTELMKAIHKDKTDAYRDEDAAEAENGGAGKKDNKDNKDKDNKDEKKQARPRLPAALWAQVPRTLGRLMRPCGGAGEGRLDFFHRTVSKAVRRRHLTDDNKTVQEGVMAFWHGRLVEYFEEVTDHNRKAEELPFHLEKILDNNRLSRVLVEWPIFERLYTEDNKYELFASWRNAAGGYTTAAKLYRQSLSLLSDNTDGALAAKICLVAEFLMDISQLNDGVEELKRAEELEVARLGEDALETALVRIRLAKCYRLLIFSYQRLCHASALNAQQCLAAATQAVPVIKAANTASGDNRYAQKLKEALILKAYGAGSLADHGWNGSRLDDVDPPTVYDQAKAAAKEALELVESLNMDALSRADVLMTQGQLHYNKNEYTEAAKLYLEAATIRKAKLGVNHEDVCGSLHRCGRAYESGRNRKPAAAMYKEALDIMMNIYGPDHATTKMCASDLSDVSG